MATNANADTATDRERTGQESTNHNNHNHELKLKPISALGNAREWYKGTVLQKQQLESELTET